VSDNIYTPPESTVVDTQTSETPFYVVSPLKFCILFASTMSFYSLYWFDQHWTLYKRAHRLNVIPVLRAVFSIFFVHSLFGAIEILAFDKDETNKFSANMWAAMYIVSVIALRFMSRMTNNDVFSPQELLIYIVLIVLTGIPLLKAQILANIACDDPEGRTNRKFNITNILFVVVGTVFWSLCIIGAFMDIDAT